MEYYIKPSVCVCTISQKLKDEIRYPPPYYILLLSQVLLSNGQDWLVSELWRSACAPSPEPQLGPINAIISIKEE